MTRRTVMATTHHSVDEAADFFKAELEKAVARGRFMAVVFTINDDGLVRVSRTTYDFPTARFDEVIGCLATSLAFEKTSVELLPSGPLPIADLGGRED